jgi:hypothetical protein
VDRGPVDRITEAQHSLITTEQFLAVTQSEPALRWAVKDAWLERYDDWRGLYIVAGAPRTPHQPHMGACLLGGRNAAAAALAAAWLFDAPDIAECAPDITVFDSTIRRIRHVNVRRSRLPYAAWTDRRHGIPVVNASLAVVQLANLGMGFLAERVANNLISRRLTGPRSILECLEATGRRRTGAAQLAAFCDRALRVRGHDDSPAARDLGAAMIAAGVPPFVTQWPVTVDGHDYLLDYAWPEQKVALEYQGWADHGVSRTAFDNDAFRRSRLTAAGWLMLDVTSAMSHHLVIRWVRSAVTRVRYPSS